MSIETLKSYDVAIIGAGPNGLMEGCLLKALNPKLNICILEGRSSITRDYGLSIAYDSVKRIIEVIDKALALEETSSDVLALEFLKKTVSDWSSHASVRTNVIQSTLTVKAKDIGVHVFIGNPYKITSTNLPQIFDANTPTDQLSPELSDLRPALSKAKVIIGADGKHSTVRKVVMGNDEEMLADEETYSYAVEVKHEIYPSSTRRPGKIKMSLNASEMGEIINESIGKPDESNRVPVTDLILVDEVIHNNFVVKNAQGEVVKGSPAKPWTMTELEERAKENETVREFLDKINKQIERTKDICHANNVAETKSPQVTTIPLSIYRCTEIAKIYLNKAVLLVGDASSGLILRRGLNKGFMEVAFSAEAVIKTFKEMGDAESFETLPEPMRQYQVRSHETFANEKWWIEKYAKLIDFLKWPLRHIVMPVYHFTASILNKAILPIRRAIDAYANAVGTAQAYT
ncbi:MAG: hypothetical protein WC222_05580 [Parachlamydiales bacterium]|jgi:2-polyprenyl-6-methoxyphenol hydroxylase-like FAD-dependent oxidoreductase